ncbi:MAG: hypothetical protein KGZ97_12835 [Bacteroidetes bacterium]|nr:hypothetical protein [Bacteroidota bacterium]
MKENTNNDFDAVNIFLFFVRWWKHLAILCVLAVIASIVFSSPYFITPKFETQATLFPASTHSISRAVLGGGGLVSTRQDFLQYGDVEDAERLLQILTSSTISEKITSRFNLMDHYEIPENSSYRYTKLAKKYKNSVSFRRTSYGAVEISIKDKDPMMAVRIANEIIALVDTIQNDMRRERAEIAFNIASQQYFDYVADVKKAEDSLNYIMSKGVYDVEGQSAMLMQQLAKDLSAGNQRGVDEIKKQLNILSKYGGTYMYLKNYLNASGEQMNSLQRRYQETKADLENFVSFTFVIDEAFIPERKSYPVRWLIVFITTVATAFTAVVSLMVYENVVSKGLNKLKSGK